MNEYEPAIEREMKKFYGTLSEKDQRRYAAVEALKLGRGGIQYMARVLGCHRNTITAGIADLHELPDETRYQPRLRKAVSPGRRSSSTSRSHGKRRRH